ncbi:protein Star-like isoform X2 [Amphibalanus amphitrite]|nr:protein Star-like isoform X2 [Amphibalanus amphitrite]
MQVSVRKPYVAAVTVVALFLFLVYWSNKSHPLVGRSSLDPELIQLLRDELITSPSELAYELQQPDVPDPSVGQSQLILEILGNKTGGTFIECGALDGETRSNTLYMERYLGWRGLLIEPDPSNYQLMMKKHRHAWTVPACLSGSTVSEVTFKQDFNMGMIDDGLPARGKPARGKRTHYAKVLCVPLEALLLALRWKTVDYFSLDVEGHEYAVLAALPFDRLDIRTLSVEFRHVPEGKEAIRRLMESKGYEVYTEITHHDDLANDFIFRRKT